MVYWFRRKYQQIKRVIDFFPLIWRGFDFDYQYSIDLFKKQLERTANHLESNRAYGMGATNRASRIRTALRLMDKVYDEEYGCEYQDKLKELYDENVLDWWFLIFTSLRFILIALFNPLGRQLPIKHVHNTLTCNDTKVYLIKS